MAPRPDDKNTMAASPDTFTPTKFPKDWLLTLVKKHSSKNTQNTPCDLKDKKILAVAPMVDQSDLPFRLLCRKYGSNVCFTPMIHAKLFCTLPHYREKFFDLVNGTPPQDRPLIAQLCGSDTEHVLETATLLQQHVDGIDLNCGCPQGIARRGNYGAFLLEKPDTLVPLVKLLSTRMDIPVSVKVRILPLGVNDSLQLYQKLVEAGASMITIHGRTRLQKKQLTGQADWNIIRDAVERFPTIPILANGSMCNLDEIRECLQYTGAAGVMSSEAVLEYPPIFSLEVNQKREVGRLQIAQQYIELAKQYPPEKGGQGSGVKCIKAHFHHFLHAEMQLHTEIRDLVTSSKSVQDLEHALERLETIHKQTNHNVENEELSWYVRHRIKEEQENNKKRALEQAECRKEELLAEQEDAVECNTCFFAKMDANDDGDY